MNNISSEYITMHPENLKKTYKLKPISLLQYPEKVKVPSKEQRKNISDGIVYSLAYMGSGVDLEGKDLSLGANYFINSSEKCDTSGSSLECRDSDKFVYVRNIPTGTIPPLNLSFYNATGCNLTGLTEGRGLVPGLVEDVYDFNPIELGIAASGNGNLGSNTCKEMTLPVGSNIYDKNQENKSWKWEKKCTSGFHTMTETTDKTLNNLVRDKNIHIKMARLPGPRQLRENFENNKKKEFSNELWLLLLAGILCLSLIRSKK